MRELVIWFQGNWSTLIGAIGIICSLLFSAITLREDCKAKQISNLLAIEDRHRMLWSEAEKRADLKRILSKTVDILNNPITADEDVFLRRILIFFETGWRLEKTLGRGELKLLAADIKDFFALPLPREVWEKTKQFRNPEFVRFVERAVERSRLKNFE